jgi:hypothetical protein
MTHMSARHLGFDTRVSRFLVSSPGFARSFSALPVRRAGSVVVVTMVVVVVVPAGTVVVVVGMQLPRWRHVRPTAHTSCVHGSPSLQTAPNAASQAPSEQVPLKVHSCTPVHGVPSATAVYSQRFPVHASTVHASPSSQSAAMAQAGRSIRYKPLLNEQPVSVAR